MNSEHSNKREVTSDEISLNELILGLKNWLYYLVGKWRLILIWVLVGCIAGYLFANTKKPIYTASTTFVLDDGNSGGGGMGNFAGLASMAGLDLLGGGKSGLFQGDNILELYRSRKMIEKTLLTEVEHAGKTQLLVDLYIDANNLREEWSKSPGYKPVIFKKYEDYSDRNKTLNTNRIQDSLLGTIASDINKNYLNVSKLDKKLGIINAEVKAPDEFFAKAFNDEIVKNVSDFYVETKTKKSMQTVALLQQKVDSIRSIINGAIYTAAATSDATPNLNPTRQMQRSAPIQRSQFSAETNKVILGELVKNLELAQMSWRMETPLIQVIDSPIFPLAKSRLSKMVSIIVGAFIFGFIIVMFLTMKRFLNSSLKQIDVRS